MVWFAVSLVMIFTVVYLLSKSIKPRDPANKPDKIHLHQRVNKAENPEMMPYAMFALGPTKEPCPRHANLRARIYLASDAVFQDNPVRLDAYCKCRIRKVTEFELKKMEASGVQDSLAPAVMSDEGLPTGHREKKLIPIEKAWNEQVQ